MKLEKNRLNQLLAGLIILTGSLPVSAQASLDSLLSNVLLNNPSIIGAGQYFENTRISSRTNLYPDNPELEYAYLWGSPAELGNRTDFAISQSFEFPGVYTKRSKLSKVEVEKASSVVGSVRQNTLLEAKHLWIEKVYLNRKHQILEQRLYEAERANKYLRKQMEGGEISRLKYNNAILFQASLNSEMELLNAESEALGREIERISGNSGIAIQDTLYYRSDPALLDSIIQSSLNDPMYQAHQTQVELLNLQKKLTRASSMPKIKTGYYSEKVLGLRLQGVQLGLTIPLWENANKVKAATGEIISAELAADKYRSDEVSGIHQLFTRYLAYKKQTEELSLALENSNTPALLTLAMESGEISVVEYYYETDLFYRVNHELLLAEKELHLAEATLTKYEY